MDGVGVRVTGDFKGRGKIEHRPLKNHDGYISYANHSLSPPPPYLPSTSSLCF